MERSLDPKAKALLTAIAAAAQPHIYDIPLALAREQVENGMASMNIPVKDVGQIRNYRLSLAGRDLPVRVYVPVRKEQQGFDENPPVIVFFHGGGWVFFDLDTYDPICTHLCDTASAYVVSVGYRRSPEYKFPVAVEDCFEATDWILKNAGQWDLPVEKMFLAGDSAGGNLAAVTALRLRDEWRSAGKDQGPGCKNIAGQILIYPVTDFWKPEKQSYLEFADGYGLSKTDMVWFWNQYLENQDDADNQYVSPLRKADLRGLPPALVIVSGHDPLRDEGLMYAERLKESGVEVSTLVYEEMIHGFLSYIGILKQGYQALRKIGSWITSQK